MWYLSSLNRDQTHASCTGNTVLTAGPPGKFCLVLVMRLKRSFLPNSALDIMSQMKKNK